MSINNTKTFDALAIRDTNDHTSSAVFNGEFIIKTLIIENGLNQIVTFQCQGSSDAAFTNMFLIGSEWGSNANSNTYQTCDTYIPYWRIIATCDTAPTTGSLTVIVLGVN